MRILLVDVDSLRPDHLGCYGYPRATSPTVDRLAADGLRFENCYVPDAPCLPSRTSLATGRFGIHHGAVGHGGHAADPWPLGERRGFRAPENHRTLFQVARDLGMRTASVSSFPERHAAWWLTAGLREWINPGGYGDERADDVNAHALAWLDAHASEASWLLHLNYWDPHTVYRTPLEYGNPFEDDPAPDWLDAERLEAHWNAYGPMSARDGNRAWFGWASDLPWVPERIRTLEDFKGFVDGYDTGVRWFDDHLAKVLERLEAAGVLDDTSIVLTADHGENLGELNVYGDHQTADQMTCRVPMVVRWPGRVPAGVDRALRYQFDVTATLLELAGADLPAAWDARSFADELGSNEREGARGRPELVLGQMAWSCQRSVRWDRWLLLRTYHPGLKALPETMLFDLETDPHETHDLAAEHPRVVAEGLARLERWHAEAMRGAPRATDPMQTVLHHGGPFHTRGELGRYQEHLRATERAAHADTLGTLAERGLA